MGRNDGTGECGGRRIKSPFNNYLSFEDDGAVHLYPSDDIDAHELGMSCWCAPEAIYPSPETRIIKTLVVHRYGRDWPS